MLRINVLTTPQEAPLSRLILVTGAEGMLGREVARQLRDRLADSYNVHAAGRKDLDISDPESVHTTVPGHTLVINCAAWTDVDSAEDPANRTAVYETNCTGPALLAVACRANSSKLIHISTDFVFGGSQQTWPYEESSLTMPVNLYGASKACGEREVLLTIPEDGYVLRTSWLYGASKGFVRSILQQGLQNKRGTVQVPIDQMGNPTYVVSLAARIVALSMVVVAGRSAPAGVYHASGMGAATRYELARATFQLAGLDPGRVVGISSDSITAPAQRPQYTVMAQQRWAQAGITVMPTWTAMLEEAVPRIVDRIRSEKSTPKRLHQPRVGV